MSTLSPRLLLAAYETSFRERLVVPPERAEDPEALAEAIEKLPPKAADLLELLRLVTPVGEPLPERLRAAIDRNGGPLWAAALLLPRPGQIAIEIHPQHYAAACRLNPTVALLPRRVPMLTSAFMPSLPPTDARWDATVIAAHLETTPVLLNQDGTLRRDHERRLAAVFGGDAERASLALRVARLLGIVRGTRDRLLGMPEATQRALHDPRPLFERADLRAADIVLRTIQDTRNSGAVDARAWLTQLQASPELLNTPADPLGWERGEGLVLRRVLDSLHRLGAIDAMRDADGVSAFRAATGVSVPTTGFLLMPDLDLLVHPGEISIAAYGRLCRLAPYVDGAGLHRHRLTREGAAGEVGAGHTDTLEFLAANSRTGVPPNVADTLREWQRAASRVTVLMGLDVVESIDGTLRVRVGPPPADARTFDYAQPLRARFCMEGSNITVPDGWDALTVRATVARVARPLGHERGMWVYQPEVRTHADPDQMVARLNEAYGGLIPGELEVLIRAGSGLPAITAEPAWVLRLPEGIAAALRRDPTLAPFLRRPTSANEVVVRQADLEAIRARLTQLGVPLSMDPEAT